MNTKSASKYDAIIVGAGHNGLVTAGYLARAGYKVAVFEARYIVGGCAVTEEIFPGYKISSLSYVNSLFRPEIIRDLKLKDFGFEMMPRNPSSFTPFPNNKYLLMGPDKEMNRREISKFSVRDAEMYPKYEAMLESLAEFLEPVMTMTPLTPAKSSIGDYMSYLKFALKKHGKIKKEWHELMRFLTGSSADMLNHWFLSEELKVTLATDAVIGSNASPSTPGTSYVLFHHVMGECNGVKGVWGYMRGGMGGLTQSLAKSCQALGVDIFTSTPVEKILTKDGAVIGVVALGNEYHSKIVASGATPRITFEKLLSPDQLPEAFLSDVKRINYDSASIKVNLALSELPDFTACPGKTLGPQHMGTIHISPSMQYIEEAYADSVAGRWSKNPILECSIPTSVDNTLAPPGMHIMNIFTQYGPYNLKTGTTWDQEKEAYGDRVVEVLSQYAPNIKNAIVHRQVITPMDMEREYNLTGGSLHHGRLSLDQMFNMRPVPGFADYTTPIKGLYMCASGSHPGGGVMGTPGWNAARTILKA
ncbi:MAG: NAD(P)/FAD-dependent oxidoreductase [Bacteriovorax sp.]|jgi:phytoene dehydrogenase-like protein